MNKIRLKSFFLSLTIIIVIFLIDRISKFYILRLAELENSVDIYITPYLNLFLIWNKGIAFGLLSVNESMIYNTITLMISLITMVILCLNLDYFFFLTALY